MGLHSSTYISDGIDAKIHECREMNIEPTGIVMGADTFLRFWHEQQQLLMPYEPEEMPPKIASYHGLPISIVARSPLLELAFDSWPPARTLAMRYWAEQFGKLEVDDCVGPITFRDMECWGKEGE
uniref:Uncharacterized protein n=1 Tax=viral metagenome TaxID=1070528 RepID=A0A6M3LU08_9ZZZZ